MKRKISNDKIYFYEKIFNEIIISNKEFKNVKEF